MYDKMNDIFKKQSQLMDAIGIDRHAKESLIGANLGVIEEALELFQALNKHRRVWEEAPDPDHIQEELVDILFYVIECAILLGMNAYSFYRKYDAKHQINMIRIEEKRKK